MAATATIRLAERDEIQTMRRIENEAGECYRSVPSLAFAADLGDRSREEHLRVAREGVALIAEIGREPCGFILMLPVDRRGHIFEFAVRPALQRRGIGAALMQAGSRWAGDQGFSELTLTCFVDAPWTAPAYARRGFRMLEVGSDRPGLQALIAEERSAGLWRAPRVAMHRALKGRRGIPVVQPQKGDVVHFPSVEK